MAGCSNGSSSFKKMTNFHPRSCARVVRLPMVYLISPPHLLWQGRLACAVAERCMRDVEMI